MVAIKSIKEGQTIYKTFRRKMGNTTIGTTEISRFTIKTIDIENDFVLGDMSYRKNVRISSYSLKNWRVSKPILVESFTGSRRLATKEEIKRIKNENQSN